MGLSCISNKSTQPNYQMEPFTDSPRVFYGETGAPTKGEYRTVTCERLSQEELDKIQTLVAERTQKFIWFVRVPLSSSQGYWGQLWVYLAPDIANVRYRSGLAYTIGMLSSSRDSYVSEPWQYIQVSLPDKEFDSILGTPEVYDLPYQYPSPNRRGSENRQEILTQEEFVTLLDYVRNPDVFFEFEGPEIHPVLSSIRARENMAQTVVSQPLVSIYKIAVEVRVTFGFVHNGLYARCTTITLKITEQGYEIVRWSYSIA